MLTRQRALYLVLGCAAIVATAIYFTDDLQAENRPLTDQEMANIFGRQPDPGPPPANGCYLKTVGILGCVGTNECQCVDPSKKNCADDWMEYGGFKEITRFREMTPQDDPNLLKEMIDHVDCWNLYKCVTGNTLPDTKCTNGECGGLSDIYDCRPCTQGAWKNDLPVERHNCFP